MHRKYPQLLMTVHTHTQKKVYWRKIKIGTQTVSDKQSYHKSTADIKEPDINNLVLWGYIS